MTRAIVDRSLRCSDCTGLFAEHEFHRRQETQKHTAERRLKLRIACLPRAAAAAWASSAWAIDVQAPTTRKPRDATLSHDHVAAESIHAFLDLSARQRSAMWLVVMQLPLDYGHHD
jgi:hypothetical protein